MKGNGNENKSDCSGDENKSLKWVFKTLLKIFILSHQLSTFRSILIPSSNPLTDTPSAFQCTYTSKCTRKNQMRRNKSGQINFAVSTSY